MNLKNFILSMVMGLAFVSGSAYGSGSFESLSEDNEYFSLSNNKVLKVEERANFEAALKKLQSHPSENTKSAAKYLLENRKKEGKQDQPRFWHLKKWSAVALTEDSHDNFLRRFYRELKVETIPELEATIIKVRETKNFSKALDETGVSGKKKNKLIEWIKKKKKRNNPNQNANVSEDDSE